MSKKASWEVLAIETTLVCEADQCNQQFITQNTSHTMFKRHYIFLCVSNITSPCSTDHSTRVIQHTGCVKMNVCSCCVPKYNTSRGIIISINFNRHILGKTITQRPFPSQAFDKGRNSLPLPTCILKQLQAFVTEVLPHTIQQQSTPHTYLERLYIMQSLGDITTVHTNSSVVH